jgi:transposase
MTRQPDRKRRHSPQFKLEAVRLMHERIATGLTLQRVSEELEIHPDVLREWAKLVAAAPVETPATVIFPGQGRGRRRFPVPPPAPAPEAAEAAESAEAEVRRLRRENERLRLERDFLKKAAAFFARESR